MADRDDYRGYGSPSGRYMESGEYDRDRNDRNDWRGRDNDRNWRSERGGRDEDRGFFQRAEDEVRSWFGGRDDDRNRSRNDERSRNENRSHDDWYRGREGYSGGDRDQGGAWGNDQHRGSSSRYDQNDMRGQGDRDWRSQYSSGGYESGGSRYGGSEGYRDQDRGRWQDRGGYAGGVGGRGDADWERQRAGAHHDNDYHHWRQQQVASFDRDYDEYRRENRDKFHSEFTNWRNQRQQQRSTLQQVKEHMDVVGSDDQHVGTVDKVAGDKIILTKSDQAAGGHHHSIPCGWIQSIEDGRVKLNKSADQAREQWRDEENRRALFENDDQHRNESAHNLNRSFSGTYEKR